MQLQLHPLKTHQQFNQLQLKEEDSAFTGWQADSLLLKNHNINLLSTLKTQLSAYQFKPKKNDTSKTLPLKLPSLQTINSKRYRKKKTLKKFSTLQPEQSSITEQNPLQNDAKIQKNKVFDSFRKSQKQRSLNLNSSSQKIKFDEHNFNLQTCAPLNISTIIATKVKQMRFLQNEKRVRKRDIYLAIFGQKGKGKTQKIEFDDQNAPYQLYIQRKNQQIKAKNQEIKDKKGQWDKTRIRCSSQLNTRYQAKKVQGLGDSSNFVVKNLNNFLMRY